ncbi:MAG TPA: alpha/beta fold hydrolase [Polyangiaceae bacterium]|nr:alpha/beta fold hydrolase [Polyangiaceae bacterium]
MLGRFGKLAVGGVALSLLAAAAVFVRAFHSESGVFKGQRHAVPLSDEARAIPGLSAVEFPSRNGNVMRGWYAPSRNGAAIVLTHGTGGDRRSTLPETKELVSQGFGVLAFDFPGHGESEGEVQWGEGEVASLSGALDFVAARADVNKDKLGVAGYSMGGLIAVRLAVTDQRVRALALLGTPPDLSEVIRLEYARWGSLASNGALFALKHHGMTLDSEQPLALVSRLSPRHLLVVGGEKDALVPERMARQLFHAAEQPKEFYLVPGAAHGAYFDAQPASYPAKLVEFFGRALAVTSP